jgi:hypothetical protein
LEPLLNEGYIDKTGSDIDHRSHIYYPLMDSSKVFDYSIKGQSNNILHKPKIVVTNIAAYPYNLDIISKIEEVFRYSIEKGFRTTIKNDSWKDITAKELVDRHYNNVEEYFDYSPSNSDNGNGNSSPANRHYPYLITRKHMFGNSIQIEYFQKDEITNESQENTEYNIISTSPEGKTQNILFDGPLYRKSNISNGPYEGLIEQEYLPSLNRTSYRCKEHPEVPYYDLEGIEESHFKPYHNNTGPGNVQ